VTLPAAEQLLDLEAIKQLKARYFRFLDTKDWKGLFQVFTEDVDIDVTDDAGPDGRFRGAREMVAMLERVVGPARTVHHGHMPEIEIVDATTARGVWAMFDYVEWPSDEGRRGLRGYGHYTETYRKTDAGWRIASMKLTRIRIDRLGG
jgi:ketosteroid isomerase-like protein